MMRTVFRLLLTAVCTASLFAGGCAVSKPTKYYILYAVADSRQGRATCPEGTLRDIGIMPVSLPKYLERQQITTRASENRLSVSDLDEWAEPLRNNMTEVLADNLRSLLCTHVDIFPAETPLKGGYLVHTAVTALEAYPGDRAFLSVQWSITDERNMKQLVSRITSYTEPLKSHDADAVAWAYSRLLASFSRDVALALKTQPR